MARKKKRLTPRQRAHAAYLRSPHWKELRKRWWASKYPKECYVCLGPNLPMDLHHRTYERYGCERLTDLVPVHKGCHRKIHNYHRKHRKLTLWEATREVRRLTCGK